MNRDPKEAKDPLLMDHEYDGIHEYDNPMPRWWLYIFYATIIYSVLYMLNVPGIGIGKGRIASYERDVAEARERYGEVGAGALGPGEPEVKAALADPARLEAGRTVFMTNCMPCHKADGGGSIGPNLTDAYWIHGNRIEDMLHTVSSGVLDKGMPAWSTVLKPDQVAAVVAYAVTLVGTNPPGAKGPQGVHADSAAAAAGDETGTAP
jgi:cytochrome c oxidase cbb3-type subunit 3